MSVTGQTDDAMESAAYERGYRAGAKLPSAEALARERFAGADCDRMDVGLAGVWLAAIRRLRKRGKR